MLELKQGVVLFEPAPYVGVMMRQVEARVCVCFSNRAKINHLKHGLKPSS